MALLPADVIARDQTNRYRVLSESSQLHRSARYGEAADMLEAFLENEPNDQAAVFKLGEVYVALGETDKAATLWLGFLGRQPAHHEHLYPQIAERFRQANLEDSAVEVLLDGRRRLGRKDAFSWELSRLYLETARYDAAIESLLLYLLEETGNYRAVENRLLGYATSAGSEMAATDATREGETASSPATKSRLLLAALESRVAEARQSKLSGSIVPLTRLFAALALEMDEPEVGVTAMKSIAGLSHASDGLFEFATRCEANGHAAAAATAYGLYLEQGSASQMRLEVMLRWARTLAQAGNVDAAEAAYRSLLDDAPLTRSEGWEARVRLARLQLDTLGDHEAAARTLQPLLGVNPRVGAARSEWITSGGVLAAEISLSNGDPETAMRVLEGLPSNPGDNSVRLQMAMFAYYQGDFEAASGLLDSLLAEAPESELANDAIGLLLKIEDHKDQPRQLATFARAELLERQGRSDEAKQHWRSLSQSASPALVELCLLTRATFAENRNPDESMRLYDQLLGDFPRGAHAVAARLRRARLLERQGFGADALEAYESALLLFPNDPQAPQIRLDVQRLRRLHTKSAAG